MAYDGDLYIAPDEDLYVEDRPESTALDHLTRNQLYYLGRAGSQCSFHERLNVDARGVKVYSGNPSTRRGPWVLRVSPECEGFEVKCTVAAGPSGAGSEGVLYLEAITRSFGTLTGTEVSLTNTASETDYRTYLLELDFDEPTRYEQLMIVSVMFQSALYNIADSDVDIFPDPVRAIRDTTVPFDRSQVATTDNGDAIIESISAEEATVNQQPGAPTVPYAVLGADVRDATYCVMPSCELREKRSGYDPFDEWRIRAHDSYNGAQIVPESQRGGGDNFRVSEDVYNRWRLSSIGTQFQDYPSADWDEYPQWIYVSTSDVTLNEPFTALNDEVKIAFSLPLIGVFDDITYSPEIEVGATEEVVISLAIEDISGTQIVEITSTTNINFNKRNLSGRYVFDVQMEIRDRFINAPAPKFNFRDGQLFDLPSGVDERGRINPISASEEVTGLTAGEVYRAKWTFQAPSLSTLEYVITGQPVIQQLVTQSTE